MTGTSEERFNFWKADNPIPFWCGKIENSWRGWNAGWHARDAEVEALRKRLAISEELATESAICLLESNSVGQEIITLDPNDEFDMKREIDYLVSVGAINSLGNGRYEKTAGGGE